jgi:hypothetical protein
MYDPSLRTVPAHVKQLSGVKVAGVRCQSVMSLPMSQGQLLSHVHQHKEQAVLHYCVT